MNESKTPTQSARAQRSRWAVNHFFAHEMWERVLDSRRMEWDGEWNINVATLDLSWGVEGQNFYRRADESYPVPVKWHTYKGLPGRSDYVNGNPETDFGLHDIEQVNLSMYPFSMEGLMVTMEMNQSKNSGANGFVRVPAPADMVDTIEGEIADMDSVRFERASRLLESRFGVGGESLPPDAREGARHVHVRYGPIRETTRFLDVTMQTLDWVERASRAFPGP